MATVWKVIKPQRLRVQEMRLALLNEMNRVGRDMKKDFEATVTTWDDKPKFEVLVSQAGGNLTVLVDTNHFVYGLVTKGTRPHIIRPKRAKALHFLGTYTAKTVPGVLSSRSGGASGDEVFSREVRHPGTEARNFDKLIAAKWQKLFRRRMEEAMKKVRDASGHAM